MGHPPPDETAASRVQCAALLRLRARQGDVMRFNTHRGVAMSKTSNLWPETMPAVAMHCHTLHHSCCQTSSSRGCVQTLHAADVAHQKCSHYGAASTVSSRGLHSNLGQLQAPMDAHMPPLCAVRSCWLDSTVSQHSQVHQPAAMRPAKHRFPGRAV